MNDDKPLGLSIQYDEIANLFVFNYLKGEESIFAVKMPKDQFEALAADMIKIIKNFNLHEAQEYQKKKEAEDEQRKSDNLDNTDAQSIGSEGSPAQSKDFNEESPCGASEIVQKV